MEQECTERERHQVPRLAIIAAAAAAVIAAALAIAVGPARGSGSTPRGRTFVRTITNPYLPYRPGAVWVYRGVKDGVTQTDVVRVTNRTRTIEGVAATAVSDIATHGNRLLEKTTDWYAQDTRGNVWYFGEATKAYL